MVGVAQLRQLPAGGWAAMLLDAGGQALLVEPSQVGKLVLVWREDEG